MKNVEETLEDEGVPIEQGDKLIIQRLVQEERERDLELNTLSVKRALSTTGQRNVFLRTIVVRNQNLLLRNHDPVYQNL